MLVAFSCILSPLKTEMHPELFRNTQSVPCSIHCVSVIKTSQLILCREIIAVCSEIHTEHVNTLCGQNVELLNVNRGGTYSDH